MKPISPPQHPPRAPSPNSLTGSPQPQPRPKGSSLPSRSRLSVTFRYIPLHSAGIPRLAPPCPACPLHSVAFRGHSTPRASLLPQTDFATHVDSVLASALHSPSGDSTSTRLNAALSEFIRGGGAPHECVRATWICEWIRACGLTPRAGGCFECEVAALTHHRIRADAPHSQLSS